MEHQGNKIKLLIENSGYSINYFLKKTGFSKTAVYYQFKKKVLKRDVVEKFLKPLNIPVSKFYENVNVLENIVLKESDKEYKTENMSGLMLYNYLQENGINVTLFAKNMGVSKPTVYNWFRENKLPIGTMLQAAKVLNTTVAKIKGDKSDNALEKDIYTKLESIEMKLDLLLKRTN